MKKMDKDTNALNWFEISVNDITRAKKFYETIFEIEMHQDEMMGMKMALFPSDSSTGKSGGSLVQSEMHKPSATGSLIYLNANPDLQLVADRIVAAGGSIKMPKMLISPEIGNMAVFTDSEGNTIALHSNK